MDRQVKMFRLLYSSKTNGTKLGDSAADNNNNTDSIDKLSPSRKLPMIYCPLIYWLVIVLYLAFTINFYVQLQWRTDLLSQQTQLNELTDKLDDVVIVVDYLLSHKHLIQTVNSGFKTRLLRQKRQDIELDDSPHRRIKKFVEGYYSDLPFYLPQSPPPPPPPQLPSSLPPTTPPLTNLYRWVDSDPRYYPYSSNSGQSKRRHVDSPIVEFLQQPQNGNLKEDSKYHWITASSRIAINQLKEYCAASKEHCPGGVPGPPGDKGDRGNKGDRGQQGLPGVRGPIGPDGIQGPVGLKGKPGLDGVNGLDGEPGLEGTPGRDGRDGKPGLSGVPGVNGIPGRNGTDGMPGQKGEPGISGIPGSRGSPGPEGKRGSRGIDGKPGVQAKVWIHRNETLLIAPSISDKTNSTQNVTCQENQTIQLNCAASGKPVPRITWRRDDGNVISINGTSYSTIDRPDLTFPRVTRDNMGSYVCIANNGIAPSDTKMFNVFVTFPPLVKIAMTSQMIGTRKGAFVQLQCCVEGYPEPFVDWIYGDRQVLVANTHYQMSTEVLESRLSKTYRKLMTLNISSVESEDFGLYKCMAHNQRGTTFGILSLFESDVPIPQHADLYSEPTHVVYGEKPYVDKSPNCTCKLDKCHPCPDCVRTDAIANMGTSLLNTTSWMPLSKRKSQCYLSQIGKPVFYVNYGSDEIGCWMRDPSPIRAEDQEKYWVTRKSNTGQLEEFADKEKFRNKIVTRNYTLIQLFSGNGQAIYAGAFFYSQEGTSNVIIFNMSTTATDSINIEKDIVYLPIVTFSQRQLSTGSSATRHFKHRRQKHDHIKTGEQTSSVSSAQHKPSRKLLYTNQENQMDISVDENGIWVLYPHSYGHRLNGSLVLKYNLNELRIENVWNLTVDYRRIGETFLMCGVLYAVNSTTQHNTRLSFAYDLYQNKELKDLKQIEFTNPFMSTKFISYNSRHKKLYTWDKGNILEYPLKIEERLVNDDDGGGGSNDQGPDNRDDADSHSGNNGDDINNKANSKEHNINTAT